MSRLEDRVARLEAADAAETAPIVGKGSKRPPEVANPKSTLEFAERYRRFPLATPWFHKLWYEAMDDPTNGRVFIMGPAVMQSELRPDVCAQEALRGSHLRIGIISQTEELAKHFLAEIKHELEANEDLIRQYGADGGAASRVTPGRPTRSSSPTLGRARTPISGKDVSVFSVGRGGQITGYHCDLLIVDDLETKEGTD